MLVELKSGETLNGLLDNCDNFMNLTMKEVIQTSANGEKFMRLPEIYVRGNTVRRINTVLVTQGLIDTDQIPPSTR